MNVTHDRIKYMDTVTIDGVEEKDILSFSFEGFEPTREVSYHTVVADEVDRPDLISWREYGATRMYWFILWYNGIDDPYALTEGQRLTIPAIQDFYDYARAL